MCSVEGLGVIPQVQHGMELYILMPQREQIQTH